MTNVRIACALVMLSLIGTASISFGQSSSVMDFDGGGDGASWDEAANWNHVLDPDGLPASGNPPTPPTGAYTANIPLSGVIIDGTMPASTAFSVRIGTAAGAGLLTVNGGTLDVGNGDIYVGRAGTGNLVINGGTVSVTDDFFVDQPGAFGSKFTMNAGRLNVVDRIESYNMGQIEVNGGEIIAEDDFYILGSSTLTVNGGLMATIDKLNMGMTAPQSPARVVINGGILRSQEWTDNPDLTQNDPSRFFGTIQINGTGALQIDQGTFTVAEALSLIANGRLTTTAPALSVTTVIVPDFFGEANLPFTQVTAVPEPTSAIVAASGLLFLMATSVRRRWSC